MRGRLEVSAEFISGPFDLAQTIRSGQTALPEWEQIDGGYFDVEEIGKSVVKYMVRQIGDVERPVLSVDYVSDIEAEGLRSALLSHLSKVFRFKDDVGAFYDLYSRAQSDPLSHTISELRGLRLMQGPNPYESLICSMASQNNSVVLWNRSVKTMRELYGQPVALPDGSAHHLFPSPGTIATLNEDELDAKTGMGYRAKYLIAASKMVADGDIDFRELDRLPYEAAKERLMEVPGIGPKVADCFLLYGLGKTHAAPVDVWIHRLVTKQYFGGGKVSKKRVGEFLRSRYGEWAGYAQLYLFHYARRKWGKRVDT